MKFASIALSLMLTAGTALAFPPAPDYTCYGTVRDETGRPLDTGDGVIIVNGSAGEITRSPVDTARGVGINYTVHMPMDANTTGQLFQATALRPSMPFTIRVEIRGRRYLPIQMTGRSWTAGQAGERYRLDLTLGVDSDGDGLPDSWEQGLIDGDRSGGLRALTDVKPEDDPDKDGLSNLQEYLLGTYALDKLDGLSLEVMEVTEGRARLRFATVTGRTYRIKSAPDLKTWGEEAFALEPAAETRTSLRANDTTLTDVYVPLQNRSSLYFRLYAE